MRCGKLLAESSPQELLDRFNCSSLEEAFLGLCQAQDSTMLENTSEVQAIKETEDEALTQDEDSYKRMKVYMKQFLTVFIAVKKDNAYNKI